MDNLTSYFNGDSMAADSWKSKYQMKNRQGIAVEDTPTDMHMRLAGEFARVEYQYHRTESFENLKALSPFGRKFVQETVNFTVQDLTSLFFTYFDKFKHIVPQGSIMSNLGNNFVFGSLSNCFVIASPEDSYGGICRADEELVQLMKRRGGVGTSLDNLRFSNAPVTNAAKSSTGVPAFAERYSNSTREVGQEGRRGALMLLLHVAHPDIFGFVTMKNDLTKVTGANVSVKFTDAFLQAVEADEDFLCRFPVNSFISIDMNMYEALTYNKVTAINGGKNYVMKIKAKELFDEFVNMAWSNAEPGAAYLSRIQDYAPDGVYERFKPVSCNPCGEIWMGDYDACRLIAQNLFSIVDNPFENTASINYEKLYEVSYIQQRLSDNLIDLEAEYIDRIINKLIGDPEPMEVKEREINLWRKIEDTTIAGRRTGNGITGLGDMLAALGIKYDSDEALQVIENVMHTKMKAELDCTIDLAILRGTFEGWNPIAEFRYVETENENQVLSGFNSFYSMIKEEFPEQARRMYYNGRRNVSWSTVAPTGTVSLMTQTTSGLEPLFKAYYIRRKKINPSDTNNRVDFIDQNGDKWQEYAILHPKFKEWIITNGEQFGIFPAGYLDINNLSKDRIQELFEESPWYGSEADNIEWEKRIDIQSIIQKYTSNAISSTINLPKDVSKETVYGIYMQAWKAGLKGVTIYRDGSRTGVLVTETAKTTQDQFGYTDAIKRPESLDADYYCMAANGKKYAVIVGLLNDSPYELFAFEEPLCEEHLRGQIVKRSQGEYAFVSSNYTIEKLQLSSEHTDEKVLTRFVSGMLRHGMNPKYIVAQVDKCELNIVSFGKAVSKVLSKYIPKEVGEVCPECEQPTLIKEEGCTKCSNCSYSRC